MSEDSANSQKRTGRLGKLSSGESARPVQRMRRNEETNARGKDTKKRKKKGGRKKEKMGVYFTKARETRVCAKRGAARSGLPPGFDAIPPEDVARR